jgi:hypothetical protein
MKRALKWIGLAVLTPILLFLILAAALYLPPVQNWAVQKVAAIASEKTGMEITVGHVNLEWPLDLGLDDFRMLHPNDSLPNVTDTIADIRHLTADVQVLPLLKKRVVINELSMNGAKINTNGFISDLRIKGDMEELWLSSKGIDLNKETAEVNGARLIKANLDIALSDTAAVDTTESTLAWLINADSLSIHQSNLKIHMPGDTLNVEAYMGHAVARDANIDLGQSIYQVANFTWRDGRLNYDDHSTPAVDGLDYNHIALTDISLGLDSVRYTPGGTSLYIKNTAMKEKSGLEITSLNGGMRLDSTFTHIEIPALSMKTPDSDIFTELSWGDRMKVRLNAQLGKQDLMRFMGNMPQQFIQRYPNHPLSIKGSVNGTMEQMEFTGLDINLPTAFHATVNGTAGNLTDLSKLKADIRLNAKTQDIGFATALLDPKTMKDFRIPNGITLDGTVKADGTKYAADLVAHEGGGSVRLKGNATIPLNAKGELAPDYMTYDADVKVQNLNLHHFLPKDSLYNLTADIKAKGHGTDFLSNRSHLTADATISQLHYGHWNLSGLTAKADLQNGRGQATLTGHNNLFNGSIGLDALLSTQRIEGTFSADITRADLLKLRLVKDTLVVGLCGHVDISSDLKQNHRVSGLLTDLIIQDEKASYRPDDIGILLNTNPDTTYIRAQSGDFIVKFDGSGGYERLLRQLTILSDSMTAQMKQRIIDQPAIKRLLPTMKIHVESRHDNPVANLLKTSNIYFKELLLDLMTSPVTGINGQSYLYSLNYDSTRIDTIRLNLTQKGERLTYQGQVRNNKRNPQFVFNALIDGHLHEHGLLAGLRYFDDKDRMGIRIGATAEMEAEGIRFRLMPDRPTLGYKEFNLNKDNFIFLKKGSSLQAKIDLIADDKTGLKLYTENQDSTMLQDLTLSINRLDLGELTSVIPYLPRITGHLNGDYHILQDRNEHFSVASDMAIQNMTFEGSPIGNISTELVYLMKEGDSEHPTTESHVIEARLMLDDEEFGMLSGSYHGNGNIDAMFTMTRFPLSIANGFVPDQLIGLEGYGEGELTIKGTTTHPQVDGEIYVDSAYLVSIPYGVRMRFDNDPVRVVGSHLLLENFGLYAYNDEPLNIMGDIDFTNTDRITMDMRMQARNLLLINSKQEAKSIAFGKAFVNFFARLQGPLEALKMRGRLDVLGSTDMTYMLLDSPLSTDNRLDELVKFTDFSDTTQVIITRPTPSGFEADLNISVSQGAHVLCNLNTDQTNYIDLWGGGDLRMKYNSEGIDLKGRYTLSSGEMKYSLPIIPLKTFTIKEGSFVEFTGDPMNPKLNIIATERTKAAVNDEGGTGRSVTFDCGVIITKTLNDMGLQFIIEAPEDNSINAELSTMSEEERGKVAVAMLTTGMYLTGGDTSSFSMNSALSSFLQSEINNIAGSALKTLDLSVGIDNSTDASGAMHTDYSFKFAKRFMNNRLKIELGGKVSSGVNAEMGQKNSFFDNVTMEYRLNQNATQNVKLFYQQNVYDWLEGYTNMFGAGFVWRRKLDSFWDIFHFWKKEQPPMIPPRPQQPLMMRRDSVTVENKEIEEKEIKENENSDER